MSLLGRREFLIGGAGAAVLGAGAVHAAVLAANAHDTQPWRL
jgi:hypothetical protein